MQVSLLFKLGEGYLAWASRNSSYNEMLVLSTFLHTVVFLHILQEIEIGFLRIIAWAWIIQEGTGRHF